MLRLLQGLTHAYPVATLSCKAATRRECPALALARVPYAILYGLSVSCKVSFFDNAVSQGRQNAGRRVTTLSARQS